MFINTHEIYIYTHMYIYFFKKKELAFWNVLYVLPFLYLSLVILD